MGNEKNKYIKMPFCFFLTCRYGVLSGHPRALTKAWSPIPTAHQDFESSAPSPTHGNSQSTLDAKQMLRWTRNTSVSFGDTSLPSTAFQKMVKWTLRENTPMLTTLKLLRTDVREPLKPLMPSHLMPVRILVWTPACFMWRTAVFTASPQGQLVEKIDFLTLYAPVNVFSTLETQFHSYKTA